VNGVVKPILKEIEETNLMLAQLKASFSVGTSPVDVLIMVSLFGLIFAYNCSLGDVTKARIE
jgi:hypothetical protein